MKTLPNALQPECIVVSAKLEVIGLSNVWSIGDAALVPLNTDQESPLYAPPTAQFAVAQAEVLAHNILHRTRGQNLVPFTHKAAGIMAVPYTHLTLPTNKEGTISVVATYIKKNT